MTLTLKKAAAFAMTCSMAAAIALPAMAQIGQEDITGLNAIKSSNGAGLKLGGGDVRQTAANIINVALGFLGIISVIIVLLGGFKYMISGGNEEKTTEAKNLIISGIIGLAIILSAWAITKFVVGNLMTATGAGA